MSDYLKDILAKISHNSQGGMSKCRNKKNLTVKGGCARQPDFLSQFIFLLLLS
jgi:hypothetical protein